MDIQIVPAQSIGGDCFSYIVQGPPGTGKSTVLGTMAESVGPLLVLATLAREARSWKYRQHNVDVILLEDLGWRPAERQFNANAFTDFKKVVEWLRNDTKYGAVAVDSGTELGEAAWHEALRPHGVGSPAEMEDNRSRYLPYETISNLLDPAIKSLVSLISIAARPKYVGIAWHVQPPKDDQVTKTDTKQSADHKGEGVEYEGTVLPMVRGGYRRKLASQVDAVVYTDIQLRAPKAEGLTRAGQGLDVNYVLQVRSDHERHCKLPGPLPTMSYIPNDFNALRALMQMQVAAEQRAAEVIALSTPPKEAAASRKSSLRRS